MLKLSKIIISLTILTSLSGCMYYAEYADKRADTEIKLKYKELLDAHAQCLKNNQNNYNACPQPTAPTN